MRKYRIEEFLSRMTRLEKQEAIKEICELLGIGTNRFVRIRYAGEKKYNTSATAEQLKIISEYFKVKVDDLFNNTQVTIHE
ncbi:MAG: hypothetical protein ABI002_00485 [Saprospiraceae bacterium]